MPVNLFIAIGLYPGSSRDTSPAEAGVISSGWANRQSKYGAGVQSVEHDSWNRFQATVPGQIRVGRPIGLDRQANRHSRPRGEFHSFGSVPGPCPLVQFENERGKRGGASPSRRCVSVSCGGCAHSFDKRLYEGESCRRLPVLAMPDSRAADDPARPWPVSLSVISEKRWRPRPVRSGSGTTRPGSPRIGRT